MNEPSQSVPAIGRWATRVVCIAFAIAGVFLLAGCNPAFHSSFKKVRMGMSEAEIIALLGTYAERSPKFRLGQHAGFEKEYARAAASGSSYYLIWQKDIDVVYTVGFDKDGRVAMKAFGGT